MKTLILSLTLAFFGASLAQQAPTSVIIDFPFFLYAYNNLETVTFDFTTDTAGAEPGLADSDTLDSSVAPNAINEDIEVANLTNLNGCIDDIVSETPSFSVTQVATNFDGTDNSLTVGATDDTCLFAPSDVDNYDTFSVTPATAGNDADGWLLVFTNSNSWTVDAILDTEFDIFDNTALHIATETLTTSSTIAITSAASIDETADAEDFAGEGDFFFTTSRLAYVLPLNYVLELNPFESTIGTPADTTNTTDADGFIDFDYAGAIDADNDDTAEVIYTFAIP